MIEEMRSSHLRTGSSEPGLGNKRMFKSSRELEKLSLYERSNARLTRDRVYYDT
jgi:hypothetical protein